MSPQNKKQQPVWARKSVKSAFGRWYESKGALYRFGFTFLALAFLFNTVVLLPVWQKPMAAFVNVNACAASVILNLFGEGSHVMDGIIYSPKYALTVLPSCTALEFSGIFCAAVLAFRAPRSRKLIGIIAGIVLLSALNLLRLISLYFIGVHLTSLFTAMHEEIWGIIQIPAVICLGIAWVQWASKNDHLENCSST